MNNTRVTKLPCYTSKSYGQFSVGLSEHRRVQVRRLACNYRKHHPEFLVLLHHQRCDGPQDFQSCKRRLFRSPGIFWCETERLCWSVLTLTLLSDTVEDIYLCTYACTT